MAKAQSYQWNVGAKKHGFEHCDAGATLRYLKRLAKDGDLTRERIRDDARDDPQCPVADGTRWSWKDPDAARNAWDLQLASSVLSGIVVVSATMIDNREELVEHPAFVQTGKTSRRAEGVEYQSFDEMMGDPITRAEYLTSLLKTARQLERHYSQVIALFPSILESWQAFKIAVEANLPPTH